MKKNRLNFLDVLKTHHQKKVQLLLFHLTSRFLFLFLQVLVFLLIPLLFLFLSLYSVFLKNHFLLFLTIHNQNINFYIHRYFHCRILSATFCLKSFFFLEYFLQLFYLNLDLLCKFQLVLKAFSFLHLEKFQKKFYNLHF